MTLPIELPPTPLDDTIKQWLIGEKIPAIRWEVLGRYNAERARGIVHTKEWQEKMAEEQRAFDEAHK